MLCLLPGDALRVTRSSAQPVHVTVSYADWDGTANSGQGKGTPGRAANVVFSSIGTADVVQGPSAGIVRNLKLVTLRAPAGNGANVDVTVIHYDGAVAAEQKGMTLVPGAELHYVDTMGWLAL